MLKRKCENLAIPSGLQNAGGAGTGAMMNGEHPKRQKVIYGIPDQGQGFWQHLGNCMIMDTVEGRPPGPTSNQEFWGKMTGLNHAFLKTFREKMEESGGGFMVPLVKDFLSYVMTMVKAEKEEGSPPKEKVGWKELGVFFGDLEKKMEAFVEDPRDGRRGDQAAQTQEALELSFEKEVSDKPLDNVERKEEEDEIEVDQEDDEKEKDAPMEPVQLVQEKDAIYSMECKIFTVKPSSTDVACKGSGTFFLKKLANDKYQMVVRADNSLGTILLNILLCKGLPLEKHSKKGILTVELQTSEGKKGDVQIIKANTQEEADKLLGILKKYQLK